MNREYIPKMALDALPEVPFTVIEVGPEGETIGNQHLLVTEKSLDNRYDLLEIYIKQYGCYRTWYPAEFRVLPTFCPN